METKKAPDPIERYVLPFFVFGLDGIAAVFMYHRSLIAIPCAAAACWIAFVAWAVGVAEKPQ
jgi:hypothetical protein